MHLIKAVSLRIRIAVCVTAPYLGNYAVVGKSGLPGCSVYPAAGAGIKVFALSRFIILGIFDSETDINRRKHRKYSILNNAENIINCVLKKSITFFGSVSCKSVNGSGGNHYGGKKNGSSFFQNFH